MNNKGVGVTVGTIIIAFLIFILFIGSMLLVVDDFFKIDSGTGQDAYGSDFNRSYYTGLDNARNDTHLQDSIYNLNDDVLVENSSVSDTSDREGELSTASWKSITNLGGTYSFMTHIGSDINSKLHIPPIFLTTFVLILGVVIGLAIISALRGTGRL